MNDKTKFLEDYCLEINANVYIFQPCEIKKIPLGIIPQCWYDILSREDVDKRVQGILETWKKYLSSELYDRNLLGGLYRENPVKSRNYEAVKSSKKWENVGNSYIIPALLLYRYSYI